MDFFVLTAMKSFRTNVPWHGRKCGTVDHDRKDKKVSQTEKGEAIKMF